MATLISSIISIMRRVDFLYASFLYLCLVFSLEKSYAFERKKVAETHHSHTIQLNSLFPSSTCKPSTKVLNNNNNSAFLEVAHKHGPCSKLSQGANAAPTHIEILLQDQARVKSIHSRLSNSMKKNGDDVIKETAGSTTIPAQHGTAFGTSNYVVTVGLGTPKRDLSLTFDTGSALTWTQCQPCVRSCYTQKEPIFDPSQSTSYANISCSTDLCKSLLSATGNNPGCSTSTCLYGILYGDGSSTVGYFGKEKLTLTPTDVFDNFYFGCGQKNWNMYSDASAGIFGLGRDKLSVVLQTRTKYKKIFSYCLPSTSSSTGYLRFGGSPSNNVQFTPLSTISTDPSFYGLDITGISVSGQNLSISRSVFETAEAMIDSGTVITRLPPVAYSVLRSTFKQMMSKYPMTNAISGLDTCYDLSAFNTFSVPRIGFIFSNGVVVDIDQTGILYGGNKSQMCLAFMGNEDATDPLIFGNFQQKRMEIFHDIFLRRIGFAPGACN